MRALEMIALVERRRRGVSAMTEGMPRIGFKHRGKAHTRIGRPRCDVLEQLQMLARNQRVRVRGAGAVLARCWPGTALMLAGYWDTSGNARTVAGAIR